MFVKGELAFVAPVIVHVSLVTSLSGSEYNAFKLNTVAPHFPKSETVLRLPRQVMFGGLFNRVNVVLTL